MVVSEHLWKMICALGDAIECPWCREVAFAPMNVGTDNDGIDFIEYECDKCPCVGNFSV